MAFHSGNDKLYLSSPLGFTGSPSTKYWRAGVSGLPGQCPSSQEPARAQDGRKGLPMVAAVTYGLLTASFRPQGGDHYFAAISPASRNTGAGSRNLHSAHTESAH